MFSSLLSMGARKDSSIYPYKAAYVACLRITTCLWANSRTQTALPTFRSWHVMSALETIHQDTLQGPFLQPLTIRAPCT